MGGTSNLNYDTASLYVDFTQKTFTSSDEFTLHLPNQFSRFGSVGSLQPCYIHTGADIIERDLALAVTLAPQHLSAIAAIQHYRPCTLRCYTQAVGLYFYII